jgi:hypothetical protein
VDIGPVIVGVFGGGALAALVAVLLKYRADNARTLAEASKVGAEGSATAGDALQRRYDALFDAQEREIARLGADLEGARSNEDAALQKVSALQGAIGAATADVRVARDEVVRLQHRLDVLELEG